MKEAASRSVEAQCLSSAQQMTYRNGPSGCDPKETFTRCGVNSRYPAGSGLSAEIAGLYYPQTTTVSTRSRVGCRLQEAICRTYSLVCSEYRFSLTSKNEAPTFEPKTSGFK